MKCAECTSCKWWEYVQGSTNCYLKSSYSEGSWAFSSGRVSGRADCIIQPEATLLCVNDPMDDDLYAATEIECRVIAGAFNTAVAHVLGATDDGSARFGCDGYWNTDGRNTDGRWKLHSKTCEAKPGSTGVGGPDTADNALFFLSHMMGIPLESDLGRTISCHPTNGRYLYLDGNCDFLDKLQSWLKAVSGGQQPWLHNTPPNTEMLLVADVAGSTVANDAFWAKKCKTIPSTALAIVVDMGAVRDFFKPIDGASYCEMLQTDNTHQWSPDGVEWFAIEFKGSKNGGSADWWPKNKGVVGDERKYLSVWGRDDDLSGGCCSSSTAVDVTYPAEYNGTPTAWKQPFTLSYLVAITTTTTKTTTTTTPPAIPGDVCTGSRDCTDTQCKNGRCCKADVDRACTSCDDAGFCDLYDSLLLGNENDNDDDDDETEKGENVALLPPSSNIGPIVGGVLGCIILVGIGVFVYRCQKRGNTADANVAEIVAQERAASVFQLGSTYHNPAAKKKGGANASAGKLATATASTVHNAEFVGVLFPDNGGGGGASGSTDSRAHNRFVEPEPSASGRYQGKLRVPEGYQPDSDCRMELLKASDSLSVPQLADIVEDITNRLEQDGVARNAAGYNDQFAFYAYTYEAPFLESHQQLYFVLNAALRSREDGKFQAWMPFIYYLNKALAGLPDVVTTVYKGMRNAKKHIGMYDGSKRVHWSGFSSTTTDIAVAKGFAGRDGLVLKISVLNAKNVQPYSWFGKEEAELMLSPNMEFQTSPATKKYPENGRRRLVKERIFIDLMEIPTEKIYS